MNFLLHPPKPLSLAVQLILLLFFFLQYAEEKFLATESTVVVASIIFLFEASFTKNTR